MAELVVVAVMNGTVIVGDKVAVAVGSGNLPRLRTGTVTKLGQHSYGHLVTVRIEGGYDSWGSKKPYEKTFDRPEDRIMRLHEPATASA